MQPVIDDIDLVIARARAQHVAIALVVLNGIRAEPEPLQSAAELADRRNMQWYGDNSLASGWMTFSRYARRFRRVEEAYLRELGKIISNRMSVYPDTVVAAAGDGEEELSFDKSPFVDPNPGYDESNMLLADYSPFAIAEFRDWLRNGGLYAPGQPLAGQGANIAARYEGDATPGQDTNGDGHTLNADFGTRFTSWQLRYFDWDVANEAAGAIPISVYGAGGWDPLAITNVDGFDAPRVRDRSQPWWQLWQLFRETMLWRHNVEFAKWITTSEDPETHTTVPADRWFSYQIPADYLFGATPENPNLRLDTSASAWWTADIRPYGGLGISSFNVKVADAEVYARTLSNVAPAIASTDQRWGLLEWHPAVPIDGVSPPAADSPIWDDEMAIVERYRPSVIAPFALDGKPADAVFDSGFETALKRLVDRLKNGDAAVPAMAIDAPGPLSSVSQPFVMTGWAVDLGTIRGPGRDPGIDRVEIYAAPAGSDSWRLVGEAGYGGARPDIAAVFGEQFRNAAFTYTVRGLAPGTYDIEVRAYSHGVSTAAVNTRRIRLTIAAAPAMSLDSVADGARLRQPFTVAGWAIDRASSGGPGVDAVHVYAVDDGGAATFLGAATLGVERPDVAAVFGPDALTSGYTLRVRGLRPGAYWLVVYAHSSVSGAFDARVARITVEASTAVQIDTPSNGATLSGSIVVSGWAVDLQATANSGVDALHVWAVPVNGAPAVFLGEAQTGIARPDVAAVFGANFAQCGYTLTPSTATLPPGDYYLVVYGHSAVTGAFDGAGVVLITISS
jgi:hypothetical protein